MNADRTQATYADPRVAATYSVGHALQPAEQRLLGEYLRPGLRILDIGVGGGRTVPALALGAAEYVGVDYSPAMVAECRRRFPDQRFEVADARWLTAFRDEHFDIVVFSFNGIDSIPDQQGRQACLKEVVRVLRPGGTFLFSAHNARYLFFAPVLVGVSTLRGLWRLIYAALHTTWLLLLRLPSRAYWTGYGRVRDLGTHGGLPIFVVTPEAQRREIEAAGLVLIAAVPGPDPAVTWPSRVGWYHYACKRPPSDGG